MTGGANQGLVQWLGRGPAGQFLASRVLQPAAGSRSKAASLCSSVLCRSSSCGRMSVCKSRRCVCGAAPSRASRTAGCIAATCWLPSGRRKTPRRVVVPGRGQVRQHGHWPAPVARAALPARAGQCPLVQRHGFSQGQATFDVVEQRGQRRIRRASAVQPVRANTATAAKGNDA